MAHLAVGDLVIVANPQSGFDGRLGTVVAACGGWLVARLPSFGKPVPFRPEELRPGNDLPADDPVGLVAEREADWAADAGVADILAAAGA